MADRPAAGTMNIRSKKGSTSVFLCVVLSALVMLSFAMIWSAREHGINSRIDALMHLAGESLMSEFHKEILTDYGLFMVGWNGTEMNSKLKYYVDAGISSSRNVSLSGAKVDGSRYVLVDPEPVRQQLMDYMKSGGADLILGREKSSRDSAGYHNLNHGPTIVSLPSRQLPEKDLWDLLGKTDHLKDVSGVFRNGTDRFLLGSYVLGTFNNCGGIVDKSHFFHNEVEYILCGKLTDEENEKAIVRTIKTLRFPSNLAHIYTDAEKMAQLTAAAEAIAPGPVGLAIQAALGAAWAWAESSNDAYLLIDGHKVPLIKDGSTWALSLEAVLASLVTGALDPEKFGGGEGSSGSGDSNAPGGSGSSGGEGSGDPDGSEYGDDPEKLLKKDRPVIRPAQNKGLTYEQYLRILLFMREDPKTVMRILDLIQINIRKDYDGTFLICEQCLGLSYEAAVNGRTFAYDKKY